MLHILRDTGCLSNGATDQHNEAHIQNIICLNETLVEDQLCYDKLLSKEMLGQQFHHGLTDLDVLQQKVVEQLPEDLLGTKMQAATNLPKPSLWR